MHRTQHVRTKWCRGIVPILPWKCFSNDSYFHAFVIRNMHKFVNYPSCRSQMCCKRRVRRSSVGTQSGRSTGTLSASSTLGRTSSSTSELKIPICNQNFSLTPKILEFLDSIGQTRLSFWATISRTSQILRGMSRSHCRSSYGWPRSPGTSLTPWITTN